MTTLIANESKIKPKGHLNCSITQPAKTDFPPRSLPLGDNICGIYFSLEEALILRFAGACSQMKTTLNKSRPRKNSRRDNEILNFFK